MEIPVCDQLDLLFRARGKAHGEAGYYVQRAGQHKNADLMVQKQRRGGWWRERGGKEKEEDGFKYTVPFKDLLSVIQRHIMNP